ncbi:hypothetical protein QFZ33_002803 [Arthrobacter globiformis]|nr:hypothetical protein [Arthrobacter globiformis]
MIVYRPIPPLTVGSGRLGGALVAMVVAFLRHRRLQPG